MSKRIASYHHEQHQIAVKGKGKDCRAQLLGRGRHWRVALGVILGLGVVGIALLLARPPVSRAATLSVTSTADSGPGSLRNAIANAAAGDTIIFSLPASSTITLTSGELLINKNLTIQGPGANLLTVKPIASSGNFRIFEIAPGVTASISGLTIANGMTSDSGGGIFNNGGTLTLTNSTISGNQGSVGGGISNAAGGMLTITNSTIFGNSANDGGGIFNRGPLTLTNSTISGNTAGNNGAGINNTSTLIITTSNISHNIISSRNGSLNGGGIYSEGTMTLTDSTVSDNFANNSGGGIFNVGQMTLTHSTINSNTAGGYGGGIVNGVGTSTATITNSTISGNTSTPYSAVGGGIYNNGTLTLTNSTVSGNSAGSGVPGTTSAGGIFSAGNTFITNSTITNNSGQGAGGIYNFHGFMTLTNSTVSGNSAVSAAGGILNDNGSMLTITNSTISGNLADQGGGISVISGTVTITNSTISGNVAFSGSNTGSNGGGGIIGFGGSLTLTNSTVYGNAAGIGFGGGINNAAGMLTLSVRNTIIALNTAASGPDVRGPLTSQGFNLVGNNMDLLGLPTTGDQFGTPAMPLDPHLGPLQNNGGPTQTHALLSGSPAIDKGHSSGSTTDQRGFIRPVDSPTIPGPGDGADIGAYEVQADQLPGCNTVNLVVNNTNDSGAGSLRDIIANACAGQTITFAANVRGAIMLTSGALVIDKSLTIQGPGANLLTVRRDTGGDYRIFSFAGQSATLSGLTITNGNTSGFGGGVFANGTQLAVNDCVITGNQAATGGGIAAIFGGALTINRTTISNNTANQAGGIYSQDRDAFIQDSTVSGNTSNDTGGIHNKSSATINKMTLVNTTVSGNMSTTGASAIRSEPSSPVFSIISLTNCTVTNNSTSSAGQPGAIWLQPTGTDFMTLMNTIVSGNTSGGAFSDITGDADPSSSFNLVGAGGGLTNGTQGNIVGVFNPQLAPLGNYGGPTQTHLLLAGSLAHNAGTITGAPATDQRGFARPVGAGVDIGSVENDVTLTIAPNTLPNGLIAQPYSQQLSQTGGATGTITWTVSSGNLPPNVTLNSSTGLISGVPTGSGTFNFTVAVASQNGLAGVKSYSLVISACPTITVTPASLPALTASTFFSQQLTASGGTPSYGFTISAGALPAGVTLTSGGLLSGAPTVPGAYSFTVVATDVNFCTGGRQYSGTITANAGLMFYPLPASVRLLETRAGLSGCINPGAAISAGGTLTVPARTACSGVPANAAAITGNITVVPSAGGFLTLFPSTATLPTSANSNFGAGEITNNVFTVGLGSGDGAFKIFASATTEVIVDVTGYYAPPGVGGLYFHPLPSPVRLLETRAGVNGCLTPGMPLVGTGNPNADPSLDLTVQGRSPVASPCNSIPATARVLVGNATSVLPSGSGYLTIYSSGGTRPTVASSNYAGNDVINGPFTVKLGADGKFKIYTFATTHLVVDILGYYSEEATDANGAGLLFTPLLSPVRLLETRPDFPGFPLTGCTRTNAPITGNLSAATHTQMAAGFCGLPASAQAVVGNVSVVNAGGAGFLTLFPANLMTAPLVATSNYPAPATFGYNRHYFVGLGPSDGKFKVLTQFTTDLILDASGYFAP